MKTFKYAAALLTLAIQFNATADVDSDFKERPKERFTIYTGDGNYKQAYHWSFNEDGQGKPVTIFLNHGVGGEWYDEIENEFGPCGPDYLSENGDFTNTDYNDLCNVDEEGDEIFLADFNNHHVPVGPELEKFMLKKIVGSTQFAAWYWQAAFIQYDSPVHIFMVGRYNVTSEESHLNNALYWLNTTDKNTVTKDTLPPYNFDGYGLDDIDIDLRPLHASPEISGFDNMFLYKAVTEQFPNVSLNNLIIEGRSNGGSAMVALTADYHIWTQNMRNFWSRNLPNVPQQEQEEQITLGLTMQTVFNNPTLLTAFNELLAQYSEQDLLTAIENNQSLSLAANGQMLSGSVGQIIPNEPEIGEEGFFSDEEFPTLLADYLNGNFYNDVKMAHAFYPGCRLGGLMEKDTDLAPGFIDEDGDNANGYKLAIPLMFSFAAQDELYSDYCDYRVTQANSNTDIAATFASSSISDGTQSVIGEVFSPARHGFDYKDVYKNLSDKQSNRDKADESRRAIERVVNQAIKELNLEGSFTLPEDID